MAGRNTRQRALVLEALTELGGHNTAEDVYARLAVSHPDVGKSTVYRNLMRMAEDGALARVLGQDNITRYDFAGAAHYHCQCEACGRVFDVGLPYMADLCAQADAPGGFELTGHTVTFFGLCPGCSAARSAPAAP